MLPACPARKSRAARFYHELRFLEGPGEPTPANLLYPEVGRLVLPPDVGAHTAFPLLQMDVAEFAHDKKAGRRDFIAVVDEALVNACQEAPPMLWLADSTAESRPFGVAIFTVPAAAATSRRGALQGRHPDQQRRGRRPRLDLRGRSRPYRFAHPGTDRRGAEDRQLAALTPHGRGRRRVAPRGGTCFACGLANGSAARAQSRPDATGPMPGTGPLFALPASCCAEVCQQGRRAFHPRGEGLDEVPHLRQRVPTRGKTVP